MANYIFIWYAIACFVVAGIIQKNKQATFFEVFIISIITTPIISAILALSYPIRTKDSTDKERKRIEEQKAAFKKQVKSGL